MEKTIFYSLTLVHNTIQKYVSVFFGEDKIAMIDGIQPGTEIEVSFNLSSREYNGKYYHNIDAWRINRAATAVVEDASCLKHH